jgi:formylglycine-generating enzyme required for sulfatase activity
MKDEHIQAKAQLQQLRERGVLNEAAYQAALAALEAQQGRGAARSVTAQAIHGPVATGDQARQVQSNHYIEQSEGTVVFAEAGATVIVGEAPVAMQAVMRESTLGHYLRHVISHHRYLQLQGIRAGGKLVHIELDRIYIRLHTTQERRAAWSPEEEEAWLQQAAQLAPGELQRSRTQQERYTTVTVSVEEALAQARRLVVLGDPGSGKTTLLRYLALLYARDQAEGSGLVAQGLGLHETGYLPILMPLRQVGAYLRAHHPQDDGTDGHALLVDFFLETLANQRIALPTDFFDPWLHAGNAVILLDGLDEVADPELRRRVARLVESFTQTYPTCRYVVTSRIVGYTGAARLGEGYTTTTVRDFTLADVALFLTNWHRLVAIGQLGVGHSAEVYAQQQTQQLLAAIQANPRIRELAINPLLLTVIAMVHRDRVKLPDRRAELYAEAVDVLLGKWDEARGVAETPILPDKQPFDTGDRRLMLQSVALHMHEQEKKEIDAEELELLLSSLFFAILPDERATHQAVSRFLQVIEERTGLLVARGEGVYAFSHLTFQEYLAALAIAGQDDYIAYTLRHSAQPWWREVILLTAGYLSMQSKERTTQLIRALADQRAEPVPYHNLVLAVECVRDVGSNRVLDQLDQQVKGRLRVEVELDVQGELQRARTRPRWQRPWSRLLPGAATDEKAFIRQLLDRKAVAIQALVRAGGGYWTMPYGEPEWIDIPAGEFWMGEGASLHRMHLDAFAIARVPITNAQYHLFTQATEHEAPPRWGSEQPPKGLESHPVTAVTLHDVQAYCNWLSQVTGKTITLPSEAQWVRAARGNQDQRTYPWGDDFDASRCNANELGLDQTTPVGIFQGGASPEGCLDMAGNVWEWTRTLWGYDHPYNPNDGCENLNAADTEGRVLCGGAFWTKGGAVGCGARVRDHPYDWYFGYGFRIVASPSTSGL